MAEGNAAVALELVENLYGQGSLELAEKWVHPDCFNNGSATGPQGLLQSVSTLREAFADLQCKVVDAVSDEDRVVLRISGKGTQTGPFMGLPPTGKKMVFWGLVMLRFRESRVSEFWSLVDIAGILSQMRRQSSSIGL